MKSFHEIERQNISNEVTFDRIANRKAGNLYAQSKHAPPQDAALDAIATRINEAEASFDAQAEARSRDRRRRGRLDDMLVESALREIAEGRDPVFGGPRNVFSGALVCFIPLQHQIRPSSESMPVFHGWRALLMRSRQISEREFAFVIHLA